MQNFKVLPLCFPSLLPSKYLEEWEDFYSLMTSFLIISKADYLLELRTLEKQDRLYVLGLYNRYNNYEYYNSICYHMSFSYHTRHTNTPNNPITFERLYQGLPKNIKEQIKIEEFRYNVFRFFIHQRDIKVNVLVNKPQQCRVPDLDWDEPCDTVIPGVSTSFSMKSNKKIIKNDSSYLVANASYNQPVRMVQRDPVESGSKRPKVGIRYK